jgi:hypothetical protein
MQPWSAPPHLEETIVGSNPRQGERCYVEFNTCNVVALCICNDVVNLRNINGKNDFKQEQAFALRLSEA